METNFFLFNNSLILINKPNEKHHKSSRNMRRVKGVLGELVHVIVPQLRKYWDLIIIEFGLELYIVDLI